MHKVAQIESISNIIRAMFLHIFLIAICSLPSVPENSNSKNCILSELMRINVQAIRVSLYIYFLNIAINETIMLRRFIFLYDIA